MIGQEAVEEGRVAILQRGQADVALEVVVLALDVLPLQLHLLLDDEDLVGQQAAQAEGLPLILAEGEVLGEQPRTQQPGASQVDLGRSSGDHRSDGFGEGLHHGSLGRRL